MVLLDADALIKLNRAGVLKHVAQTFDCIIPEGIFHEVVTKGRAFHYSDAESINEIIESSIGVRPTMAEPPTMPEIPGVDAGERDLLSLFRSLPAEAEPIIISDDRRFLTVLGHMEVPALTPADFIVLVVHQGYLGGREARTALEAMRPSIRENVYLQALQDLEV